MERTASASNDSYICTVHCEASSGVQYAPWISVGLGVVAILANVITVIVLKTLPVPPTPHHSFVINLIISDIIISLSGTIVSTLEHAPRLKCVNFLFLQLYHVAAVCSMLLILTMATEHYVALFHLMKYRFLFTAKRVKVMIACVWIFAFLLATPSHIDAIRLYIFETEESRNQSSLDNIVLYCSIYNCEEGHQMSHHIMTVITCLSVIFIVVIYIRVFIFFRMIRADTRAKSRSFARRRQQRRAVITTFLILITFVICWTPLSVTYGFYAKFVLDKIVDDYICTVIAYVFMLPYINCICDPIIYGVGLIELKKHYKCIFSIKRSNSQTRTVNL